MNQSNFGAMVLLMEAMLKANIITLEVAQHTIRRIAPNYELYPFQL